MTYVGKETRSTLTGHFDWSQLCFDRSMTGLLV
jgi:hypothetical protein